MKYLKDFVFSRMVHRLDRARRLRVYSEHSTRFSRFWTPSMSRKWISDLLLPKIVLLMQSRTATRKVIELPD